MFPKEIYLIGKDVNLSLSKPIQETIFQYLGKNINYIPFNFNTEIEVQTFIDTKLNIGNFISNVTMPYKQYCMDYLTNTGFGRDVSCKNLNGTNLIMSKANLVYNFDGFGFVKFLEQENICISGKRVLICGTGATSMSISNCIKALEPASVELASRHKSQIAFSYNEIKHRLDSFDFVIDAVPIEAESKELIDLSLLNKNAVVIDISYSKTDTPLLQRAKNLGLLSYDGKSMLICQAVLCIQQICRVYNFDNKKVTDFEKLYNIGAKAIGL